VISGDEEYEFGFLPSFGDHVRTSRQAAIREASLQRRRMLERGFVQIVNTETGHIFNVTQIDGNPNAVFISAHATNPCG
jgi:hypothetical protein